MDQLSKNPLVSIVVITYNSEKYVLETLESIKAQKYPNIELIVSDDCSTDKTVELCKSWIEANNRRFNCAKIITSHVNTGIAPNCNRGLKNASGEWIKFIAGDDKLEDYLIEEYINKTNSEAEIKCIYSNVRIYKNIFKEDNLLPIIKMNDLIFNSAEIKANEQFRILLRLNPVWTSTLFIKKELLDLVGGFNEKYPFFEDRPLLISLTKLGFKIHYLDIFGAKYRRRSSSIQSDKSCFFSRFREDRLRFFIEEYSEYFSKYEKFEMNYTLKKNLLLKKIFLNRNYLIVKVISRLLDQLPPVIKILTKM